MNFVELRGRPTYHDLMDPDEGYVRGAQTEFFDVVVRDYSGGVGTRVEDFTPLRIVSVSPRNEFFQPISWNINVGWSRRRLADGSEPLVFNLNGGPGLAWTVPDTLRSNTLKSTPSSTPRSKPTRGSRTTTPWDRPEHRRADRPRPGAGGAEPYVRAQWFFTGDTDTPWAVGLRQRYTLEREWALRLDLSRERQEKQLWNTVLLSLHHYF